MNDSMERKQKIAYKVNLKDHLAELSYFNRNPVTEASLLSIEETKKIMNIKISDQAVTTRFTIPFKDKNLKRFSLFIDLLYKQNPGPMFIWTKFSEICGCVKINSIKEFNFQFPFSASSHGIVTIITKNITDKIVFDYYLDEEDKEMLEVSLIGNNWSAIHY